MEIQELQEKKQLLIWLTRADLEDKETMLEVDRIRNTYKASNWLVITYLSGTGDSFACTLNLLRYNRDRAIAEEMEPEPEKDRGRYLARTVN